MVVCCFADFSAAGMMKMHVGGKSQRQVPAAKSTKVCVANDFSLLGFLRGCKTATAVHFAFLRKLESACPNCA